MANLLLELRKQIARNRRKAEYTRSYIPKAAPMPAVADGKIRIEPENLDDLEPEGSIQSVTIIQNPSQPQFENTGDKMEEQERMDAFGTEEKKLEEQNEFNTANKPESFQFAGFDWNQPLVQEEYKEPEPQLKEVPEQEFNSEETVQQNTVAEKFATPEIYAVSEANSEEPDFLSENDEPETQYFYPEQTPLTESVFAENTQQDFFEEEAKAAVNEVSTKEDDMGEDEIPQVENLYGFDPYETHETEYEKASEPVFSETIRESTVGEESKDDFLMKEIDEFRDRAKRLQMLLDNRETEAEKLKSIVNERQEKADALQEKADELDQILQERQQEADGITLQVERQIDSLINKVSVKMDELEATMTDQNEDGRRFSEQKAKEVKETLGQIQEQLTTLKTELSEKVHTENVKCFRNISDALKGTEQKMDSISDLEDSVNEKIAPVKLLGMSSLVVGVINFVAIIIMMIVSMISAGAVG